MRSGALLVLAAALIVGATTPAMAWTDDFEDGYFWYDANHVFDGNLATPQFPWDPYPNPDYDPNDWDPNNPQWTMLPLYGSNWWALIQTGPDGSEWLRIAAEPDFFSGFGFMGALVNDGGSDPNTSTTYFTDDVSHYMLAKIANPEWEVDPNDDAGYARFLMHTSILEQKTAWLNYEFYDDRPWAGAWFCIEFQSGSTLSIRLPNGEPVRPDWVDTNDYDPNDPNWHDPNNMWATPGYMDEHNGFWMLFQWEAYDPNYGVGDPNGKAVWGVCWNGDKYDWNGEYMIGTDFPNYPNHPRARSKDVYIWESSLDPNVPDPNYTEPFYVYEGPSAVNFQMSAEENPAGIIGGAAFDNVEMRFGEFDNQFYTLDMTIVHPENGTVTVDPENPHPDDPFDPNTYDPNDPNTNPDARLLRYGEGQEVMLVANPEPTGKGFNKWEVTDPGDANNNFTDTNTVLYLTMDRDWEVAAKFKCGSAALMPMIGLTLLGLGIGVLVRRFA